MNVALSGNIEAVKLLLSAPGINIKAKDNEGKMAVDFAKQRGVEDVTKLVKKETSLAMKVSQGMSRMSKRFTSKK